jgi:hypothetical protein
MGRVYQRKVRVCTTCDQRLDTTAARRTCEAAGHVIRIRAQPMWWLRYTVNGRLQCVSSRSVRKRVAQDLLKARERDVIPDRPVSAPSGLIRFEDAAMALVADYRLNAKRSLRTLSLRINKHLRPFFGAHRLTEITPALVRDFITRRQAAGASNATINRDLITLKRMYTLAVQDGTPHVEALYPVTRRAECAAGFLRTRAMSARAAPSAGVHAGDCGLCVHHGVAHPKRDPATGVAPHRPARGGGAPRRRHDEEPRGPGLSVHRRLARGAGTATDDRGGAARARHHGSRRVLLHAGREAGPADQRERLQPRLEPRSRRRGLPRPDSARLPAHRRAQPRPGGRARARRHATDGAQNARGVRALQHRESQRSARGS